MCDFNVFKQVLITVGTTDFDELIDLLNVSASEVASYLRASGCCTVRVQIGRGKIEPLEFTRECIVHGIDVTHFRFASSMEPEILGATLVISHAGAGSVVETLNAPNRPYLVVVVNDTLMGNHQRELADAMAESGYCASTSPSGLIGILAGVTGSSAAGTVVSLPALKPYPPAQPELFAAAVAETVLAARTSAISL